MKRIIGIVILLIMVCQKIHAQQSNSSHLDLVITSSNDTLQGKVVISNRASRAHISRSGQKDIIEAREAKAIYFKDGSVFLSKKLPFSGTSKDSVYFVRVLVEGYTNLYELQNQGVKNYFFQKKEQKIVRVKEKYFPNYVKFLTFTCDSVNIDCANFEECKVQDYEKLTFSKTTLTNIISEYNACIIPDAPSIVYKEIVNDENMGDGVRVYGEAGVGLVNYNFSESYNKDYGSYNGKFDAVLGGDIQFKKIVLGGELNYEKTRLNGPRDLPRDKIYYSVFGGYLFKVRRNYIQPFVIYSNYKYVFSYKKFNDLSSERYAYGVGIKFHMNRLYIKALYRNINFVLDDGTTGVMQHYDSNFKSISLSVGYRISVLTKKAK